MEWASFAGTNVTEVDASEAMIARARQHGMYVTANFMKSYASSPREFAAKALLTEKYGTQAIYIVDSAGGMLQSDLEEYFVAVRDVTELPIGFHGHNNLGLAASHAARAVELGAAIIDTTLQGLGRSSGNVPTELFLLLLKRMGMTRHRPARGDHLERHRPLIRSSRIDRSSHRRLCAISLKLHGHHPESRQIQDTRGN